MKHKLFVLLLFTSVLYNGYSQSFSTWSGTIRFSGGLLGGAMIYSPMMTSWLLYEGFSDKGNGGNILDWVKDNHLGFLRFFNAAYDFVIPQWSMTFLDNNIESGRIYASKGNTFHDLFFTNDKYINYIGYQISYKDLFSRLGIFGGIDYELRKFSLEYKLDNPMDYHFWHRNNEIQLLVPTIGIRYRIISPEKEIEGFPFNVVFETGLSYAIVLKYVTFPYGRNYSDYDGTLKNGFRTQLGIAITTNKLLSVHIRWTNDLYNLFDNAYVVTDSEEGLLKYNIKTNLGCFSIGLATFL